MGKDAKTSQWRKEDLFNRWSWDNRISTCKRIDLYPYLATNTKIHSQWITGLNISAKAIKLLEKHMGAYCGLRWIRQKFLRCNTKQYVKEHINKLNFITIIKLLRFKIHCEENGKTIHRPEKNSCKSYFWHKICVQNVQRTFKLNNMTKSLI